MRKETLRVASIQMSHAGSSEANIKVALEYIDRVMDECNADLIVLPEFFNTEYFFQYPSIEQHWAAAERADGVTMTAIKRKARERGVAIVATIYEDAGPGHHHDTAFFVDANGQLSGRYRKTHAPGINGGYEKLYYRPGDEFPVFDVLGWSVGAMICYDRRFPEVARALSLAGADLIVAPFATTFQSMWVESLATRAWENQTYLVSCNRYGVEDKWDFFGRSLAIGPDGTVIAEGACDREDIVVADLDYSAIESARMTAQTWRDRRPELYGSLTKLA